MVAMSRMVTMVLARSDPAQRGDGGEETLSLDQEAFCSPRDAPNVLAKWPGLRHQRLGSNTHGHSYLGIHSGKDRQGRAIWSPGMEPPLPPQACYSNSRVFLVGFVSLNFHFLQCQTLQKIQASPKAGL